MLERLIPTRSVRRSLKATVQHVDYQSLRIATFCSTVAQQQEEDRQQLQEQVSVGRKKPRQRWLVFLKNFQKRLSELALAMTTRYRKRA